jgi:hypothetical protein
MTMAFIYATVRSLLSVSGYLYNLDILNFPKAKALNATYNLGSISGSGPSTETPARMQEKRYDNNRVGKKTRPRTPKHSKQRSVLPTPIYHALIPFAQRFMFTHGAIRSMAAILPSLFS